MIARKIGDKVVILVTDKYKDFFEKYSSNAHYINNKSNIRNFDENTKLKIDETIKNKENYTNENWNELLNFAQDNHNTTCFDAIISSANVPDHIMIDALKSFIPINIKLKCLYFQRSDEILDQLLSDALISIALNNEFDKNYNINQDFKYNLDNINKMAKKILYSDQDTHLNILRCITDPEIITEWLKSDFVSERKIAQILNNNNLPEELRNDIANTEDFTPELIYNPTEDISKMLYKNIVEGIDVAPNNSYLKLELNKRLENFINACANSQNLSDDIAIDFLQRVKDDFCDGKDDFYCSVASIIKTTTNPNVLKIGLGFPQSISEIALLNPYLPKEFKLNFIEQCSERGKMAQLENKSISITNTQSQILSNIIKTTPITFEQYKNITGNRSVAYLKTDFVMSPITNIEIIKDISNSFKKRTCNNDLVSNNIKDKQAFIISDIMSELYGYIKLNLINRNISQNEIKDILSVVQEAVFFYQNHEKEFYFDDVESLHKNPQKYIEDHNLLFKFDSLHIPTEIYQFAENKKLMNKSIDHLKDIFKNKELESFQYVINSLITISTIAKIHNERNAIFNPEINTTSHLKKLSSGIEFNVASLAEKDMLTLYETIDDYVDDYVAIINELNKRKEEKEKEKEESVEK
jgi:hypothetical protein